MDVVDPHGLVRSQAIRSGGLRITLNGAEARRTLAGRFIEDTFGASVQHIALACEDIFVVAAKLRRRDFPFLQIGPNYYADLEARFGMDSAQTARLKDCNVMYDEDKGGRFFQLYSVAQPSGFFLEIIQRLGAYDGYGASNAPFRIAAQKRGLRPDGMPKK